MESQPRNRDADLEDDPALTLRAGTEHGFGVRKFGVVVSGFEAVVFFATCDSQTLKTVLKFVPFLQLFIPDPTQAPLCDRSLPALLIDWLQQCLWLRRSGPAEGLGLPK
jgi:hypothetical protein